MHYFLSAIGRTLIPRYFRSIFEGDVTDLYFSLKHPKESFHNTTITLDCDQCTMVAHHGKPMYNKVNEISFNLLTVSIYCSIICKVTQFKNIIFSEKEINVMKCGNNLSLI